MVAESAFTNNFTSFGKADAFSSTLVGLHFWHLITFPTLVDILNALGCREPVGVVGNLFMANHKGEIAAAHLRLAVYDDFVTEFLDDTIHELSADFFVGHFAATEDDHYLNTIAVVE